MLSKVRFIFICGLVFASSSIFGAKVDTIQVWSASMKKDVPTVVVTPDNYRATADAYPVVYLLHGAGGSYKSWISQALGISNLADEYNMLIVCPDGAVTSWYLDSPVDSTMRYETFVAKELPSAIDTKYNTIKSSKGRAITGLSMGGHGGLFLSWRHQDVFGAGGSMSGGVDIRPYPNNWDLAERLGPLEDYRKNWEEHAVTNMVDLLNGTELAIIIDCGVDDFFFEDNQVLHSKLVDAKIEHDYIVRPGGHTWDYWRNAVQYQLLFFSNFFKE
jgi:S-formylglutathione hydrolase FrmB